MNPGPSAAGKPRQSAATNPHGGEKASALAVVNLRSQAAQVIRARIVAGELHPGVVYQVGTFAEELGVSATPIREALLDLSGEGLVEMMRNRGFRVRVLTDADLDEIAQLRLMLEVPAMVDVVERADPEQLVPLAVE